MALARVKTWNPGDTLTAADLNAEFNNPLNNPITLISPTTGAINFQTSVAHTNLQVSALTASSGFAGSVLVTSTAAAPVPIWSTGATAGGVFVATTAAIPTWLSVGSGGQPLTVSSSAAPRWGSTGSLVSARFQTSGATVLTAANFSISTQWGSTASLAVTGTPTDQVYRFTVTAGSTTQANPTVTCTFADGAWSLAPLPFIRLDGGTGVSTAAMNISISPLTSGQTFTPQFTPTTGLTYTFSVLNFV